MCITYEVKFENPKMLPNFHAERDNFCPKIVKFNVKSYVTCHKNITLMTTFRGDMDLRFVAKFGDNRPLRSC